MNPIDIVILVAVVGALAAIVWRAVAKSRRAKAMPAQGCDGCSGCSGKSGSSCCH